MADFNNQAPHNNTGVIDVSTNSIAMFGTDSSMLRIGFRGDMMFFTIIPRVEDPNGGKPRWPKEMGHSATFRPQTAMALYDGFMQKILPDIKENKDHDGYCVVPLNREATNLCGFAWAKGNATFSIFSNVNESRVCNEIASFTFQPTTVIDTYDPTTGIYTVSESHSQLLVIVQALRLFSITVSGAIGHNVKNLTSWNNDVIQSHLRAIVSKIGATPAEYGRYRGYNPSAIRDNMDQSNTQGGSTSYNQAPLATPSPISGENGAVAWSTAMNESNNIGHTEVPDVHQVSSLENLMA